jgi:hypothetical protein
VRIRAGFLYFYIFSFFVKYYTFFLPRFLFFFCFFLSRGITMSPLRVCVCLKTCLCVCVWRSSVSLVVGGAEKKKMKRYCVTFFWSCFSFPSTSMPCRVLLRPRRVYMRFAVGFNEVDASGATRSSSDDGLESRASGASLLGTFNMGDGRKAPACVTRRRGTTTTCLNALRLLGSQTHFDFGLLLL